MITYSDLGRYNNPERCLDLAEISDLYFTQNSRETFRQFYDKIVQIAGFSWRKK